MINLDEIKTIPGRYTKQQKNLLSIVDAINKNKELTKEQQREEIGRVAKRYKELFSTERISETSESTLSPTTTQPQDEVEEGTSANPETELREEASAEEQAAIPSDGDAAESSLESPNSETELGAEASAEGQAAMPSDGDTTETSQETHVTMDATIGSDNSLTKFVDSCNELVDRIKPKPPSGSTPVSAESTPNTIALHLDSNWVNLYQDSPYNDDESNFEEWATDILSAQLEAILDTTRGFSVEILESASTEVQAWIEKNNITSLTQSRSVLTILDKYGSGLTTDQKQTIVSAVYQSLFLEAKESQLSVDDVHNTVFQEDGGDPVEVEYDGDLTVSEVLEGDFDKGEKERLLKVTALYVAIDFIRIAREHIDLYELIEQAIVAALERLAKDDLLKQEYVQPLSLDIIERVQNSMPKPDNGKDG